MHFPIESQLQQIEIPIAFKSTSICSFFIPSKLINLGDGLFGNTKKLTKIIVSPKNPRYCRIDEKFIYGKSNIEQLNYDILIFCVRNIESITNPSFVKKICSSAFSDCTNLHQVEIPINSELQTIENDAFINTQIKYIRIPSQVTKIGEKAFYCCLQQLQTIEIPNDSKLETNQENAFSYCSIESINIPSHPIHLGNGWCIEI